MGAEMGVPARQRRSAPASGADEGELVSLLQDVLGRLGVDVRFEDMPEEARISGGFCRVHGEPELIVSPHASCAEQLGVMIEALGRLDTEQVWLPPVVRDLLEGGLGG